MDPLRKGDRFADFVSARNNETVIRWQKVQIFFLINSVLVGITASATLGTISKLLVSIFGFFVTLIWWLIQWEAQNAIDYWNAEAARQEPSEENGHTHGFAFAKPREGFYFKFVSTHYLILFLVALFAFWWIGLIISHAYTLLSC